MATVRNKTQKYVTIESKGIISELGGISGPILHPTFIDLDIIVRMVNTRKKVYEVNPSNTSEKVLLTLSNVKANNFPQKKVVSATKATTAKTETKTETKAATTTDSKTTTATSDFTKK